MIIESDHRLLKSLTMQLTGLIQKPVRTFQTIIHKILHIHLAQIRARGTISVH